MTRVDLRAAGRTHGAGVLVAGLSSAFGVTLLGITAALDTMSRANPRVSMGETGPLLLTITGGIFVVIAMYVGGVVTANTFATLVAGRRRTIALMRLLGSSARTERRRIAREGLAVGGVGAVAGALAGVLVTLVVVRVAVAAGVLDDLAYPIASVRQLLPVVAVVLTTWLAAWSGSRRVLDVAPIEALGAATERSGDELTASRGRTAVAIVLVVVGLLLLGGAVAGGLVTPLAVLPGVVGGLLSFTGVVLAAHLVFPPVLRLVGRITGRGAVGRLAAENAVRYPERSARTAIGLVIGVTLITMFGVATASFARIIRIAEQAAPGAYGSTMVLLDVLLAVFGVLIGFSAVIAAVGMANALAQSVLQRTRELGLLRALGFTRRQVAATIRRESAQLTIAAVALGLVLGTFYGWVGAQSMLARIQGSPGIVTPGVPWALLGVLAVATALVAWGASAAPARRAARTAPVEALRAD